MSSLIISYLDDENGPFVYATPAYKDSDGTSRAAQVVVDPWGPEIPNLDALQKPPPKPEKTHVTMYFSLNEAEVLAKKLTDVVERAKKGIYSDVGVELVQRGGRTPEGE